MIPTFQQTNLVASQTRDLPPCTAIRFSAVSGAVTIQFGSNSPITVSTGDSFATPWPLLFPKITIVAGAAGSATVVHGIGALTGVAASSAGVAGVQSTAGDPEGVLNANVGQLAYDASAGALYLNPNTSGTTGWVALIL